MYGDGYGYHPYGGVSVGVGYGGYGYGYDPYYGYGGYGAYDPFGWYGDYYYPGVGIYVYDHHHNRHVWNDQQRRYWQDRHSHWQSHHGTSVGTATTGTVATGENWSRWDRSNQRNSYNRGGANSSRGDRSSWHGRSSATTQGTTRSSATSSEPSARYRPIERANDQPQ